MEAAKFFLRKQGKKSDPVITIAVYDSRFPGRKFIYSTKQVISLDRWKASPDNKNYGFPKKNDPKNLALNAELKKISTAIDTWLDSKIGVKGPDSLRKDELNQHLENIGVEQRKEEQVKLQHESDFFKIWQKIIDTTKGNNGEKISANTRLSKNQTLNLVTKYCVEKGIKLSFDSIDMDFYHSFDAYMDTQGLSPNSKGKHIKEIKSILREAVDRDISVNNSFTKKSFKVIRKETDNTYLTEAELKRMLSIKYSPSKEALRDLFVMACFTGLRHSDWHQIKKENIVIQSEKQFLKIKQKKTTDDIHIPLHPIVKILLNKYNGMPPRVISNQKFNDALKEICKHDDLKLGNVIINGESVLKAEQISTHSARRSFATNAYLSKSMSVYSIMSCTGHKTESSFLKYLKLSGLDKAVDIADSKFFSDAGWTNLKVA